MGRIEEALGARGVWTNCKAHAGPIVPGGRNFVHPILSSRAGSNSTLLRVHFARDEVVKLERVVTRAG